jgi:AcrR family transcriptional regulator
VRTIIDVGDNVTDLYPGDPRMGSVTMARPKNPELRASLVEAAQKIFTERGYSKATISEIVKEAGIAQGTFYLYFKSKDDMVDAVAENVLKDMVGTVREIGLSTDKTALVKVQEIIRFWLSIWTLQSPLIGEFHEPRFAPLHERMASVAVEQLAPVLTVIVRQGVSEGTMDALYPEVTAINWFSARFNPNEIIPGTIDLTFDQMVEAYADFVCRVLGIKDRAIIDDLVAQESSSAAGVRKKGKRPTRVSAPGPPR